MIRAAFDFPQGRLQPKQVHITILLFLMLVTCIALLASAMNFRQRLEAVRSADSDNKGWITAQLEVDYQGLLLTVEHTPRTADETEKYLSAVRREFDVYYSRIDILETAMRRLNLSNGYKAKLARLVASRDEMAAQIDALTVNDLDPTIEKLHRELEDMAPLVRSVAVDAVQIFAYVAAERRAQEERLFIRFLAQSLILFVLMGIGTYLIVRLWRELEKRTVQAARVASSLTTAFNSTLSAVIIADLDARVLFCNDMAEQIFGYPVEQMVGQSIETLIIPDHMVEGHIKKVEKYRDTGQGWVMGKGPVLLPARHADGSDLFVEVSLVSDTDISGKPVIVAYIRDVSEQVTSREKLQDALEQAQQAAQAKSMFLATMSHEMRTPLHGLMASLGLIDEHDLNAANQALLKTARDCSERALAQVNDVLELTRMGEIQSRPEEFSPSRIAADIIDELQPLATQRNNRLQLITRGPHDLYRLQGLPFAFSRALYNLAGNAVKFTQNGQITLTLTLECDAHDQLRLNVSVEDTGIGIAPEDQERIFRTFETVGRSEIDANMGTGLGLSIANLAVEQQGGQLHLDSVVGQGSRFYFTIPVSLSNLDTPAPVATTPAPVPARALDNLDILVVEDNEVNLTLMCEMLKRLGHRADPAHNGQVAVQKAKQRHYDVILMDFSMPVMDGPAATHAIRTGGGPSAQSVILGVTALIDATAGKGPAQLMNEVLVKPVSQSQLNETLQKFLGTSPAHSPAPTPAPDAPSPRMEELKELMGADTAVHLMRATLADATLAIEAMQAAALPLPQRAATIHNAVGSCGVMGLLDLSETLSEAECMALAGRDPANSDLAEIATHLLEESRREFRL
ncbi:PAS/PAC sensor hybrid histidine kinase [Thalassovita litoralis]|uniref:histidine kinase n=1 Tax=Thalassovita litoralis TaxID=1010611 RepID=A0A521C1G5_9RHOB|nr:PAS/PAC sensor hybrid histidine kinase [Thalassovita litoralis]